MKKIIGIIIMTLVITTVCFQAIGTDNNTTSELINYNVVWDNGMNYDALGVSQIDEIHEFDFISADDVLFEEDTEIHAIKVIGGYRHEGYQNANFSWEFSFYNDQGNGNAPGELLAGPFTYTHEMLNPIFIEDTGSEIIYEFLFTLPETISLTAEEKYWIVPISYGELPAQGGLVYHFNPIKLHQAVSISEYFNSPNWQNVENISTEVNEPCDGCFQLLSENVPPNTPVIDGPTSGKPDEQQDFTFSSNDPDGNDITYCIDWGDGADEICIGPFPSGDEITQSHTWTEEGTYIIKIKAQDTLGDESDYGTLQIEMPKMKQWYNPFVQFLQNHPYLFPLLRYLIRL
jgi:hypothetical protein